MATDTRPNIFLLSLKLQSFFDQSYASLIDGLYTSAQVKRAKGAVALSATLRAILRRCVEIPDIKAVRMSMFAATIP